MLRFTFRRALGLIGLGCAMAVLAPGLAQAQTFSACFNPLIDPSTATTSANVGSVVRFYGINNLSGCFCGGSVTANVTVQGLDPSEGASVRIYPSAQSPALM
jgi:hypothetical protein